MTSHGWIILPTRDIRDNKFHPVRYYVVTRGGSQNPDQSCYCDLAGTREGPMSKQGAQNQKASSICFKKGQ